MLEEWAHLAEENETEWIAYLTGDMRGRSPVITGFYFPPQVASGAHVAQPNDDYRAKPDTIGAVHSHVRMAAFWSGTDEAHANWPVEIVINWKGEHKVRVRLQLDCHRFARIDSKLKLTGSRPSPHREALEAALREGELAEKARHEAERARQAILVASQAPTPAVAAEGQDGPNPPQDDQNRGFGQALVDWWEGRGVRS
jgi:hypothetical protein